MSVETFACKTCAAPIAYDIKEAKWKCEYCGSEFEKNEIEQQTGKAGNTRVSRAMKGLKLTIRRYYNVTL